MLGYADRSFFGEQIVDKNRSEKKLDIIMIIVGVVCLAVFAASLGNSIRLAKLENKKVSGISEITVPDVPDVKTERAYGVVSAAEWSAYYSDIYKSYMANAGNTGHGGVRIKYTETDPDIQTLYSGYGFAYYYTEAVGHNYTLQDVAETTRPHKLANCLTCKTPDMTAMVNALGTSVYSTDFDTVYAAVSEPISCYNCHGNTPGTIVITHDYMADAMNADIDAGKVPASSVSCAQCHIEYYFDPATKATKAPYKGVAEATPDAILAYYNSTGFYDFENPNTGVRMIKVQHPEFETYYGKGSKHKGMYTCADCHMGVSYNEKGDPYANHYLSSPLDNKDLIKTTCKMCHTDLAAQIKAIQDNTTKREKQISAKLVEINKKLAAAIEGGTLPQETIDQIKALDRDAQFYWDFVYVENSEGAHNSTLTNYCLDRAEELAGQALDLLK